MSDNLNRVQLWSLPRTLSTVLLRCLSFVDGAQVVNEPYGCAYYIGPEGTCQYTTPERWNPMEKRYFNLIDDSHSSEEIQGFDSFCTYDWIRDEIMEAPYEGKKILLCKNMSYHFNASKYPKLPRGFKHSFLIRHPIKVFTSWHKLMTKVFDDLLSQPLLELPGTIFPAGYGFKEMHALVEYVENTLHQEAVIIDTDDLLSDPAGILSAYCHMMGIPYSPELLCWKANSAGTESWIMSKSLHYANSQHNYFETAFQSSGFNAPSPLPDFQSLPPDVQVCASASMKYYEKLREKRLTAKPITKDK